VWKCGTAPNPIQILKEERLMSSKKTSGKGDGGKAESIVTTALKDFVFCISGTLSMKRKDFQILLEKNGAKVESTVNSKVTHLIVENPALNTAKSRAAYDKGIVLVDEQWVHDTIAEHLLADNQQRCLDSKRSRTQQQDEKLENCVFFILDDFLSLGARKQMELILSSSGLAFSSVLDDSVTHIIVGDLTKPPQFMGKLPNAKIVDDQWVINQINQSFQGDGPKKQIGFKPLESSKSKEPPLKKKQRVKEYGVSADTDGMRSLLAGKEFTEIVQYDIGEIFEAEGTGDIRDWQFSAPYWNELKKTKITGKKINALVLPWGEFCLDIDDPCAWRTWKQLSADYCSELEDHNNPSMFDVLEAAVKFYKDHSDKLGDNLLIDNFQVSKDGTWLACFNND
jgi:hypothetical protein